MQTTGPIDRNVAFLPIQASSSFHAAASTDAAELKQPVENRAVITDIVLTLLAHITVHVVGGNLLQEIDIVIGVKLGHLSSAGGFGTLGASQRYEIFELGRAGDG